MYEMDVQSEQLGVLRDILKWVRFTGMKEVKSVLVATLDTNPKKIIYQLSDGEKGSREIAKAAGVSDWTVRDYWKKWAKFGIVEALRAGSGERYKHSFNLESFGIEVPQGPKMTGEAKREQSQETLPIQDQPDQTGGKIDE